MKNKLTATPKYLSIMRTHRTENTPTSIVVKMLLGVKSCRSIVIEEK